MKKKILSVLLSFIILLTAMPLTGLTSFAATSGDFEYSVLSEIDKTCEITNYTGSASELTIPKQLDGYSVISVGGYTFRDCTSLISITIPDSVTSIDENAFFDCDSLLSINVSEKNLDYSSENGVLFNKDGTVLIKYPVSKPDNAYIIPTDVISIGYGAFGYCKFPTKITISNSVTSIGERAFEGCTSLKSVILPNSVTDIGYTAFRGCTQLENITVPNSVMCINGDTFKGCTSLTNIIIPDSVTSIGNGAFEGCTALASITIPDSVTHISGNVFENTAYYNNPLNWENDVLYIGNHIIKAEDTLSGEYAIRSETKTIADSAFENCKSLTSVTIPDSVITIGWYAFRGCAALEQIIGMKNITRIDDAVFKDTAYYEDLRNWENGVLYIGACLIEANKDFGFKGGYYTVKDNTKTIANRAFYRCDELTELIIPDSVISIGEYAFVGCTDLKSVTLPEFISEIKGRTFLDCVSLKQIEIPKSVVRIYSGAFRNSGLESVIIPESVTEFFVEDGFYPGAFSECDKLKYVELPDTIKEIPYETFYGCDSLSNVVMPVGIEKIGEGAFANCAGLTRVNIPESVTSIAKGAFCNCENLKELYIPSSVFNLDEQAYGWDIYEIDKISKKTDVTIYGYLGTEAEQFAKNNDFHFCKLKDVCDDGTAIKFYTKEIANSEECSFSVSTDAQSKNTILYNIQYYVNNIPSKPTAPVTVKIPVPASMNGADCKVYRQEADGTYTDMNAFYQNGYMVFTTDHFSVYVLTTESLGVTLGDINSDGTVDDWDSVLLDRYLAGWDVQVDASVADIDQNGVVDDWDGVLLSRNLAGWKS